MDISIEDFDLLSGEVRALKSLCLKLRDTIEGGLISNNLHANAIQTNNIKDDVITGSKIIADAITAEHIQALAIDASKIAIGTITSSQIEEGTIAADRLKVGDITALQISSGSITAGLLKTGGQAFSHSMTFSSTDSDTVSWTSGSIKTADGTVYSIDAGDTGNMAARTYIYLDKGISETVLQTSTSYDAPLGDERIPIATAKNSTGNAVFQVFQGGGGVFISGGMIAAHTIGATQITAGTITASEIASNAITAAKINVSNLQSVSSTLGTVSVGTISGTRFRVGGGTNEDIYFEDSGIRFYDVGSNTVRFYKSGSSHFEISLSSNNIGLSTNGISMAFSNSSKTMSFSYHGTLNLPTLSSAPTGYQGDIAVEDSGSGDANETLHFYVNAHWLSCMDSSGW